MRTKYATMAAGLGALLLAGCTSSDDAGPPHTLACDVTYRAGPDAEPQEATVQVDHHIGEEGNTDSVTFAEGEDAELTFMVSYRASHVAHGLVQIWMTPADGSAVNVQTIEFEGDYPGGPQTTGDEDVGDGEASAEYVCGAAA